MASSAASDEVRHSRLLKFFNDVLHGQRHLSSARDGKLFVEAVCAQLDPATCAHKLIKSPSGLSSLQASVRFDTSLQFLNGSATLLLNYLQAPSLEGISSGSVLAQLLSSVVEPPFFWDAFTKAFRDGLLVPTAFQAYAWLLLQLIRVPGRTSSAYLTLATSPDILNPILKAPQGETRVLGEKIKHLLALNLSNVSVDTEVKPGGRHDNDFEDIRKISIMPTGDELLSKERPFLRIPDDYMADPQLSSSRLAVHMDNQFRLLREDMLGEIREELQILMGRKSCRHKGLIIDGLRLVGVDLGLEKKRQPWGIMLECERELPHLREIPAQKRKAYLLDNRYILKNQNMACLMVNDEVVAFPTIRRNEDELAKTPAIVIVQLPDDSTAEKALLKMKCGGRIKLVQLDSAVFSFEPILQRLQEIRELPLSEELLEWEEGRIIDGPTFKPTDIIQKIAEGSGQDLSSVLDTERAILLDESQMRSLCASLSQRVSLVQGPPGTGKSFIGALVAKVLHTCTSQVILVICYTNHALDQFLEDLMDIGITASDMVRLGSKSTDRTKPITLREQTRAKLNRAQWERLNTLEDQLVHHETRLRWAFNRYQSLKVKYHLMEYLEFNSMDLPFFDAFSVPTVKDGGMTRVGRNGKAIDPFYLLDRWYKGLPNAGILQNTQRKGFAAIWEMTPAMRQSTQIRWETAIIEDFVEEIGRVGREFNSDQAEASRIWNTRDASVIQSKRIIACTTTGAAMYAAAIQAVSPGVVLVEEAGEILEAHIFTALGPRTEQLILIGDHKQLRPRCSHVLSVAKGDGYDLNRSLFERLVLKGFPHITLSQQHRMRPEISAIVRHLTYPDLLDASSTKQRKDLRGFRDNVIFVNHSQPEIENTQSVELKDPGSTSTKQNQFEAEMLLKCVRYLAQQGYGSDKLVILTPYLGQLKLLRDQLSKENDPILNDLDKYDLIRAGLLTDISSTTTKPSLRISTIDNYQGEESEIVLASLTRSNRACDIGFMDAPERLNVLLSRARDALIMIGNSHTFIHARKGREVWPKFFDYLKQNGHVYEGFPVKCEKHPDRTALLSTPGNFEAHCPDGGCKEPCRILLNCGVHQCPSRCHQLFDHSKIKCTEPFKRECPKGHSQTWLCHSGAAPLACKRCEKEERDAKAKARKAIEDQQRREEKKEKHLKDIAKVQDEIDQIIESMKDARVSDEQATALEQKRKDLANVKELAMKALLEPKKKAVQVKASTERSSIPVLTQKESSQALSLSSASKGKLKTQLKTCLEHNVSKSKTEWQRQKDIENASNPAIDKIMEMIGLESVKQEVLRLKSKVETSARQGTDLKKERLGLVLLGNPGTGKTTVARHYAGVLTSLQVLAGNGFVETTGSRLAHGGSAEVKKHLETLDNGGGGVYFIDEAYQLAEGHNHGGKTVLDFILAEIENLVGTVVFVFAGYKKQMEKFFEHNPGFRSRIPYTLQFEDYTDAELLQMLQYQIDKHYKGSMSIEDGTAGLYMRIAVRRLGRGRGRDGFGNARALENLFAQIRERQSERLSKERKDGLSPDDYTITKEDLIGPDPSKAILHCDAWEKLQSLTGLKSVKTSVSSLIDLIKTNYERELEEEPLIEISLNRVFLGSPGTGKTSVAKLYGRILADIGLLSNGEVVTKNPADFVGNVLGQSEANTKAILATTVGKVLIIDEAYMLYSGSSAGGSNGTDLYKTAVIDTIVAEVQSVPGEDRCVLLLGYEDQMVEMFQNVNPGLTRRFQLSDAFRFEDFNDAELQEILRLKLRNQGLGATEEAISVAIDCLSRARNGLNFGNGGDVENLISQAKTNFQSRQSAQPPERRSNKFVFEPQDFDPDFDRASGAETNLQELFKDVFGCDAVVAKLEGYLKVARGMKAQGLDPRDQIPMNFIFKGPPGTGKTTTARKIGKVFYDLGFLSQVDVVECSATDLIGQCVGQTGPKTIKQLERGLGKVLFIDEAYRLGEGYFAQEAVNELVDTMTKPKFLGKLVIILAGYDNDMNNLLRANEGLSSRFGEEVLFPALSPEHCLQLLEMKLKQTRITIPALHDPVTYQALLEPMRKLSNLPSWGNARDVQTLSKSMVRTVFQSSEFPTSGLVLSDEKALACLQTMLSERQRRNNATPNLQQFSIDLRRAQPPDFLHQNPLTSISSSIATRTETETIENHPRRATELSEGTQEEVRDPGVADAAWAQQQNDKRAAELEAKRREETEKEAAAETAAAASREALAQSEAEAMELLRQREEARIREVRAKVNKEKIRAGLERRRLEDEKRKREEVKVQSKLREMGVCEAGFRWIKQSGGYRCAGGSHFVSDGQLGI